MNVSLSTDDANVRLYAERAVATARVALSAGGLLAVALDPAEPAQHAALVYGAIGVYVAASVAVLVALRRATSVGRRVPGRLHAVDVAFAGVLTGFTLGPGSPFFVFVWFVVLAAAFRSGLRGAIQSAAVLMAIVIAQVLLLARTGTAPSLNLMVVRATYLAVMTFLVGYMAQKARDLRTEAVAVARVLTRTRQEGTLSGGLRATIEEVAALFDPSRAVLLLAGRETGRHCWVMDRGGGSQAHAGGTTAGEGEAYFFPIPPDVSAWWSARQAVGDDGNMVAVNADGHRVRGTVETPPAFWEHMGAARVFGAVSVLGEDWEMRLYLGDPAVRMPAPLLVHVLRTVMAQAAPAVQNLYLLGSQARAEERAQLGRELHDRIVQSLIGIEMQLAAIGRHAGSGEQVVDRARALRATVIGEIDNVRDLMQNLRPITLPGEQLRMYLSDLVARFRNDTGIRATLQFDVDAVNLTTRQCGELVRIVQEGLVNVRKHSGATSVDVSVTVEGDRLRLLIQDDGCGFDFSGRLAEEDLWSQHKGPRVIRERTRVAGGRLAVESQPGHGARIEVEIPHVP